MKWKLWGLLLLCVVIAFIAICGRASQNPVQHPSWQSGLDTKIKVPVGEELRVVELYPDRITSKHAIANFPDGRQEHYWYRPNSKLAEAKTFSSPDVNGKRVLIRHAYMDRNGVDYLSDIEFSLDGEVTKRTLSVSSSLTFRWFYHPGGEVKLFESFEPAKNFGWSKILADEFSIDAVLVSTYRRTEKGFEVVKYAPDKTILARFLHEGRKYNETWYFDDGVSIKRVLNQDSDGTGLKLFHRNGKLKEEHLVYGPVTGAAWYSKFFDSKGQIQLEHRWVPGKDGNQNRLEMATHYVNGFSLVKIDLDSETGKLKQVIQYLGGNGWKGADIIYVLRLSDGFLESRHHREPRGGTISWIKYDTTTKEVLPVKIAPDWLEIRPFDVQPPQVVKYELSMW